MFNDNNTQHMQANYAFGGQGGWGAENLPLVLDVLAVGIVARDEGEGDVGTEEHVETGLRGTKSEIRLSVRLTWQCTNYFRISSQQVVGTRGVKRRNAT
jgi:hypothetical protein